MNKELKPVNCGCGGEAKVISYLSREYCKMAYYVRCENCGTETDDLHSEAEAIESWNRAMGIAEKSSTVERTAKAKYSNADGEYLCRECGRVVQIEDAFCCGCGARLEWE